MAVVLASASSARRRMLEQAGVAALSDSAEVDEAAIKRSAAAAAHDATTTAGLLAEAKARAVAGRHPGALVIGADQMLECDGGWYDKPGSPDEARAQLTALRGRSHTLISAAVILRDQRLLWHGADRARLTMRDFSDAFLETYLTEGGEALCWTVGCYRIEGPGIQLFSQVEGDHFVILGLPLLGLLAALRELGELTS